MADTACHLSTPPKLPFTLDTNNGVVRITQILRFLPHRRLVVKAEYESQALLLKLLADTRQGQRHIQREINGHRALCAAGLPAPEVVFTRHLDGLQAIAYSWLPEANSLTEPDLNDAAVCKQLMTQLATLHNHGLTHEDLHLDNLLLSHGTLYLVDYAAIRKRARASLKPRHSLHNLAWLLAQFTDAGQQQLLRYYSHYARLREWQGAEPRRRELIAELRRVWRKRLANYLKKCFRRCTMTAFYQDRHTRWAMRRRFYQQTGELTADGLDALMQSGVLLKDGNSATVVRTRLGEQDVVIKRYNIKSFAHWLKRCWRPSRAANAWKQGHTLRLIGIDTPAVLGFLEKRHGGLWGRAYLITAFTPAPSLADITLTQTHAAALDELMMLMKKYQLSHGDMKASNLLAGDSNRIAMIDLDAMRLHAWQSCSESAHKKDVKRLKANWHSESSA